ncbi:MAG TPA: radical SAM protein [Candidatus Sulfotelmatobacter sp.]|nr:radical SAM protein [Candidatus Sulfotelmatobacter sp.]
MLTGIHILLTLKCTNECDHCFLHCGPSREATFTIGQLRTLIEQIKQLGTVTIVYFEGGEPFLFYPLLLEGLRLVRNAGFGAGIVTNGYWATSIEDGLHWLRPIRELGVVDFSVSDDEFHRLDKHDRRAEFARQAAQQLGIPTGTICIDPPYVSRQASEDHRGKPVIGGGVLFKGRAAEKLTAGLPVRPCNELTTCPHEDLLSPERVHVDAHGNVHLCQGLSMGNIWEKPLAELVRGYDAQKHPIAGPLLRGGPIRLAQEHGLETNGSYVDGCHLCYTARKVLLPRFPQYLAPKDAYGL